jgi:hypothetical protein
MRRALPPILLCIAALALALSLTLSLTQIGTAAHRHLSVSERIENLQEDLDSLTEDVEDLKEPVAEFDTWDECMYTIGVTEYGKPGGAEGYSFGGARKPALALDIYGFGQPQFWFLAFPGEEPPSIECNEDVEQEINNG